MTGTTATGTTALSRTLGPDGPSVSALGVGTWAIGGPFDFNGRPAGWGEVDDDVSVRALHAAFDAGITLVDTAPTYGCGHAERVLGRALGELPPAARDRIVVATKFGLVVDEATRTGAGADVSPSAIRAECEASRRRLGVEAVDLHQLHSGADTVAQAEDAVATLEDLVAAGSVRAFGCGQDTPEILEVFAPAPHCAAVQTQVNVFGWDSDILDRARRHGLDVLARSPLAMGLLSGGYSDGHRPPATDVRRNTPWWTYFDDDAMADWLGRVERVRSLLTSDGRSLVQGALAYLWSVDGAVIPLPGIRTPEQAVENAGALACGPLADDVAAEVTALMADSPERR
jgi:aryl-alcohol dehydrogenase-like predicted oxidoreductase